jgi:hypothetical protein
MGSKDAYKLQSCCAKVSCVIYELIAQRFIHTLLQFLLKYVVATVPDTIKAELLQRIQTFLQQTN